MTVIIGEYGKVRPDNRFQLAYNEGKKARMAGLPRECKLTGFELRCWLDGWDLK